MIELNYLPRKADGGISYDIPLREFIGAFYAEGEQIAIDVEGESTIFSYDPFEENGIGSFIPVMNQDGNVALVVNCAGENIYRNSAWFAYADNGNFADEQHRHLDRLPLQPSIRIEFAETVLAIWLINGTCDGKQWEEVQTVIQDRLNPDCRITNPLTGIPLPGTYATDEAGERELVVIESFHPEQRYTVDQMLDAFYGIEEDETEGEDYIDRDRETEAMPAGRLAFSLGEYAAFALEERQPIFASTQRGEVAQLTAATNIGKTTLMLNLGISLTCGREFLPMLTSGEPRRVLYVDFETQKARLIPDIYKMLAALPEVEREDAKSNLLIICEGEAQGESLSLPRHIEMITRIARDKYVDVIMIDTVGAGFDLNNENDNSEVIRKVQRPLAQLARDCNAVVLYSMHTGKGGEESNSTVRAYRGRGASAFGAQARTVLLLTATPVKNKVTLSLVKVKGEAFPDTVLNLDSDSRWFSATTDVADTPQTTLQRALQVFSPKVIMSTEEVHLMLGGEANVARRTVQAALMQAKNKGFLREVSRGRYILPAPSTNIVRAVRATPIDSDPCANAEVA